MKDGLTKREQKTALRLEAVVNEIIEWIDEQVESRLSLEIIAKKSGYTKWYFQRLFKEQTGMSLGFYVRSRRLACAAKALCETQDSIMTISMRYYFDSQQTFCRAFKQQYQLTPSAYRRHPERYQAARWQEVGQSLSGMGQHRARYSADGRGLPESI